MLNINLLDCLNHGLCYIWISACGEMEALSGPRIIAKDEDSGPNNGMVSSSCLNQYCNQIY